MSTVAQLSVRIGANISGLQRGVQDADRSLSNFSSNTSKRFDDLKGRLDNFVSGFAPLSIAAGGALGYGVKVASDFESVLAEIEARSGATAGEMEMLRGVALRMGAETAFSSQQAAEAMLQLLTSGASAEEAIAMLPAVLDAAAASGENLGRTADAVTDIMASFQLQGEQSAGVAESLARASGSSSATMGQLIDAFVNGGSAASAYGLSVNRSSAILALFAERGVKGAEAGTLLKSMLQGMDRQTDGVRNAWRQLGTSMYDTEGNMRDFAVVIEEIKQGLAGMTMEEQNIVLQELAGSYGIAGLRALTTGQSIAEMEARMAGAASVSDVAQARMDTFAGKVDTLKGSFDTFMVNTLTPFMDNVLSPLTDRLTDAVNGFNDWAAANPEVAGTMVGLLVAVAVATPMVWGLSMAIGAVKSAALLMTGPVGLLVLAMGALVAGTVLWNTQLNESLTFGDAVVIGLQTLIVDLVNRFRIAGIDLQIWAADFALRMAELFGDETGAINARIRLENLTIERGNFEVGDELYKALLDGSGDFREGLAFNLPDDLAVKINSNPAALADNLSIPTRLMLVEAWNAAVASGNMDFIEDAAPLIVALDQQNLLPTVGPGVDIDALKQMAVDKLNEAALAGDNTATLRWGQMALDIGVDSFVVSDSIANAQNAVAITDGINQALSQMTVTGTLDLSGIDIMTGMTETLADGTVQRQTIPLSQLMEIDPEEAASIIEAGGPELRAAFERALAAVVIVGDGAQQRALLDIGDIIGIDPVAFSNSVRERAAELRDSTDVGAIISEAIQTNDTETLNVVLPLLPALDIDRAALINLTQTELALAYASGNLEAMNVFAPLAVELGIDGEALYVATHDAIVQATDGVAVGIGANLNPTATINPSFRDEVGSAIAAQVDGLTVTANVMVQASVVGSGGEADDGSHRSGLGYVPFDGYRAELHQGEAVLTARQAAAWRSGGQGGTVINLHVSSYGESDYELARRLKRALEDGAR